MAMILIVDTQKEFCQVLRNVLETYGHAVSIAGSGEEAKQILQRTMPAAILFDPVLHGRSSLLTLSQLRAQAPDIPVVVVADSLTADAESRIRELGVTDFLRKDLKMSVIMQAISRVLQRLGEHEKKQEMIADVDQAPSFNDREKILIVDDEHEICEMVGQFLTRRNYQVRSANSAVTALELIKKAPPDLVILDIYMPGMNGVELLRKLNKANLLNRVGVIMLTASQEEPLLQEALDIGAFDVLSKPVDLSQLEMAVAVKLALSVAA